MVTEYIKRKQKMGYDSTGTLIYKIPMDQEAPVQAAPAPVEEEAPVVEIVPDNTPAASEDY